MRKWRVIVKDTKRWGYCKRNGDLVLNWQLIALPRKLAEYVILHELAHLSEFSHSKGFRARLAAMCPDYREREDELKKYHASEPAISVKP
ncbi:MAG: M48 family metallopeptidase [Thermoplasmata archaeon]